MRVGQPSRTALATAHARAFHQVAAEPRIFTDPLAVRITGLQPDELIERDTATLDAADIDRTLQRRRRLFLAARSRFAEETVAATLATGTRQVVILGAGLDTFAYRNPHADARVFEVDHPDTQEWKRQRLAEASIDIPANLTFAPVDFEAQTLGDGLIAVGFDRDKPAVFVWLGVVMYLTRATVLTTLRFLADQAAPVTAVLDYLYPPSATTPEALATQQTRINRVASIGEPWLSFFTAEDIARELREVGFTDIEDLAGADLVGRYLNRPTTGSPGGAPPHILRATAHTG